MPDIHQERSVEIRSLMRLNPVEVIARAEDRLDVAEDVDSLHQALAEDIAREITKSVRARERLRLILPVGPTGQYPILASELNRRAVSLENCSLYFMDEYCLEDGATVGVDHPLSFRRQARELFLDSVDAALRPRPEQIVFPSEANIASVAKDILANGGIDVCYGGIGIHGHLAFNEPESGVADSDPRRIRLNDFTVTINAIRAGVGGNIECFPRYAYTLGMRQILQARRIVLACRNGSPYDWANTVLRLALFGRPGDDYPVTHIRNRNYRIITDRDTLASPKILL